MGIWKGNVRAVVALKSCKWFAREMGCRRKEEYDFSQDTLTFMIKGFRHTKRKPRHLNLLVLNGKKKIELCNSKSMTKIYISALIVRIG